MPKPPEVCEPLFERHFGKCLCDRHVRLHAQHFHELTVSQQLDIHIVQVGYSCHAPVQSTWCAQDTFHLRIVRPPPRRIEWHKEDSALPLAFASDSMTQIELRVSFHDVQPSCLLFLRIHHRCSS